MTIRSKPTSRAYRDGWERLFGGSKRPAEPRVGRRCSCEQRCTVVRRDGAVFDVYGCEHFTVEYQRDPSSLVCPHRRPIGRCHDCDVAADLAFDADREKGGAT